MVEKIKNTLSVAIIAQDEERVIGQCLDSMQWADEIVVVDGFSTDRTVQICKEKGAIVYQRQFDGFAPQKKFALEKTTGTWILSLDADEWLSEPLQEEIKTLLKNGTDCDGFFIPRLAFFLGRTILHGGWYPGYQMRLFKRGSGCVREARVQVGFLLEGKAGYLKHDMIHDTHPTIQQSIVKLNRYSSLEAHERLTRKRIRWYHFFLHPAAAFLRKYVGLRGFLDGMPGFILALIDGMVKLALYIKIWELQHQDEIKPITN